VFKAKWNIKSIFKHQIAWKLEIKNWDAKSVFFQFKVTCYLNHFPLTSYKNNILCSGYHPGRSDLPQWSLASWMFHLYSLSEVSGRSTVYIQVQRTYLITFRNSKRNFKWSSIKRWQGLIYNYSHWILTLIKNVEDTLFFFWVAKCWFLWFFPLFLKARNAQITFAEGSVKWFLKNSNKYVTSFYLLSSDIFTITCDTFIKSIFHHKYQFNSFNVMDQPLITSSSAKFSWRN